MACTAAAVLAPAAGAATVTAPHPLDPVNPLSVTYDDPTGENNNLTLTNDGTTLSFTENVALISFPPPDPNNVGAQDADDCTATDTTNATCQTQADTTVNLGDGDDTLTLGTNLPSLTVHGGLGTDRVNFDVPDRTTPVTLALDGSTLGLAVDGVENVTGGAGGDHVVGDGATNVIDGGLGSDQLSGGAGNDRLSGGDGNDRLSGGDGVDDLTGGAGVNVLRGGLGGDILHAGDEGDTLVGGAGADDINGGAGDDDISAADGEVDHITCGPGFDTVSADANDVVPTDADAGTCEEITFAAALPDARPAPTPAPTPDPVVITDTSVVFVPVLGSIAPVLAPGPANVADLTPPGAAMRSASRQRVRTILKRGGRVPVRVTCQEACGISVALSVDRTTAKRLKLDSRTSPVVIGTASAKRALAGSSVLRVKLTSKVKAGLKASKRNSVVTTQVLVSDASGNGTLLSRHITLVR